MPQSCHPRLKTKPHIFEGCFLSSWSESQSEKQNQLILSCFIQWKCCLIFQNLMHVHSWFIYNILKYMIVLLIHVVPLFNTMTTNVQIFCKSEKLFMITLDTGFVRLWYKPSFTYNLKAKTWIHYHMLNRTKCLCTAINLSFLFKYLFVFSLC